MALTTPRRKLAALLAAGDRTFEQIAVELNVPLRTLKRWAALPEVAACVEQIAAKAAAALERKGITEKANRLRVLNDLHERQLAVIQARSDDPTMAGVPGGDTGLLVRQAKLVKVYDAGPEPEDLANLDIEPAQLRSAKRDVLVYEYAADTGLLAEIRQYQKQAAIEMGQWVEKHESDDKLTVNAGDELAALERSLSRLAAAGRAPGGAGQPDAGATEPAAV